MRSARIAFANKKIWIIGGGKQALIRGKQFLEEGASITFLGSAFCEELEQFIEENQLVAIQQSYERAMIQEGFLVYACTDNREVNHEVVLDANADGFLSASVHKDQDATYHPLQFEDYPHLHVAVSTNGASPGYNRVLLQEFGNIYEERHHNQLEKLREERMNRIESSK